MPPSKRVDGKILTILNGMRCKISLILIWTVCSISCHQQKKAEGTSTVHLAKHTVLLEADELLERIDQAGYVLVDFRPTLDYGQGHIPNAINIWRSHIEDTSYAYPGMIPTKSQLEQLLSAKGVHSSDTLILYDDRGSCDAARLWWVLNFYGFHQTKILNGGLDSYVLQDIALSNETPEMEQQDFLLGKTDPKHYISLTQLKKEMKDGVPLTIIDCRTEEEFSGQRHKQGAKKAGRIPNSVSLDWIHSIDPSNANKFLPIDQLEKVYQSILPNKNENIVVYCHSGVRSAHTTFVLTQLLAYKNVRNYEGSWTEWSAHDLPFEKDVATTIFE